MFGSNPEELRSLAAWLFEQEVEEAVMESTAQCWKPVWEALLVRARTSFTATVYPILTPSAYSMAGSA
jgi:hypothetical protein